MQPRLIPRLAVVFILAGLGGFLLSCSSQAEVGPAPAWELKDVSGKTVKLSDFKGKVLVLNFWATWCPPCKAEIPDFIQVQKEFQDKNVVIVGASLDSIEPREVADFAKKIGINYQIVMTTEDMAQQYVPEGSIPVTVIIDPQGNIRDRHLGIIDKGDLEELINKAIAAK